MGNTLERFARRMTGWLWAPPEGMPLEEMEYAEWIKPEGRPLRHRRWKRPVQGKGRGRPVPRRIDEFYHRGPYERHGTRTRPTRKISLRFRGKGAKTERRHGRCVKK